jgi:hypothetical protein
VEERNQTWFEASLGPWSSSKPVAFRRRPRIASRLISFKLTRRRSRRCVFLSWSSPAVQSWRQGCTAAWLGRSLCAVMPSVAALRFEVFQPSVGSWGSPHDLLSWASALLQSFTRTTATTLASRRRFREVLRPYSVFNRECLVRACLPTPSAFDVSTSVTVSTPAIYARLLGTSAPGVHPSKFFPLTLSRAAVAFGTRAVPSACLSARRWSLPTCRFRMCRPTNKFAVSRIRVGFWALLPLRVRQPPAGLLGPRTVRCSPGFCLSKDFSLSAPSPLSRAFRSRACPSAADRRSCPSTFCSAERSAFPHNGSWYQQEPLRSGRCPF